MMTLLANTPGFGMPESASTYAAEVDYLWDFIVWVSIFFVTLIAGLMAFFAWRYRMTNPEHKPRGMHHSTVLELGWAIPPLIILIAIFALGFKGILDMTRPPANSYNIIVTGWKWAWEFQYPNGATSSELHVPAGVPIHLTLQSRDVIHSFYVPQFRIKKDVVPGRYNETWFEVPADQPGIAEGNPGIYDVYCAEYCGTSHSKMLSRVVVHTPEDFETWVAEAANIGAGLPPAEYGRILYEKKVCYTCHSVDGSRLIGPSFLDAWGTEVPLAGGATVAYDANYVRNSILNPNAQIHRGYQAAMPVIPLQDDQITALIAYIRSLGEVEAEPTPQGQQVEPVTPEQPSIGVDVPAAEEDLH